MPTLKVDIHIHTDHSDSESTVQQVVQKAREKGLDGIAITDHMDVVAYREASEEVDGLLNIPGMEVESKDGHILVLGVEKVPRRKLSMPEAVEWARREGGVTVVAHPTVPGLRVSEAIIRLAKPDAVETCNALVPLERYNRKSCELAERLGLPQTGGSDSHIAETVGDMYTLVDAENRTIDDVLEAIKKGRIRPAGRRSKLIHRLAFLAFLGKKRINHIEA